jgi:type IV pilus assembly protein PilY1
MHMRPLILGCAALCAVLVTAARAQTSSTEDFTGTATTNSWYYYNGACLTAGSGVGTGTAGNTTTGTVAVAGIIPSCASIATSYYKNIGSDNDPALNGGQNGVKDGSVNTLPDPSGQGALRFTNGYPYGHNENGAIISATPFNAGSGVQITFKTITYRGDAGGTGKDGADGLSFYLLDATQFGSGLPTASAIWNGIGAFGGSLGYTCANNNNPSDGVVGGYLGLGIDEYGNFLNAGDNTASGYGYVPQRIGLRGAGSISWKYLNKTYPTYYPSSVLNTTALQQRAVRNTCANGVVLNYSSTIKSYGSCAEKTTYSLSNPNCPLTVPVTIPALFDYAPLAGATPAYAVLPASTPIAGEWNAGVYSRPQGTPIFYNLTITQDGLLSLSYAFSGSPAYTSIISGRSISSTNALPTLPASLYFGFAGSSGGDTNIHEIMCFKAAPANQSSSSAAVGQQQAAKVATNAQVYFSYYNPNDWTGRLTANGLVDTGGVLTINALANWDAQCVLTGVATLFGLTTCATTGSSDVMLPELPINRVMLTWNGNGTAAVPGTAGVPFEFPISLAGSMTVSQALTITAGELPLNLRTLYLRGNRLSEINIAGIGLYRPRNGVLGDIIDSSPAWVGPPASPYTSTWSDKLASTTVMGENSGQSYAAFQAANQSRLNVVYAGANDGFLHGFGAGQEDSSGLLIDNATTPNDGNEVLAYMPAAVLQNIHNSTTPPIDYSNSQYAHAYYVDGSPGSGDLYYGGAWHTWLAGGLGPGGAAIYALDITNASSFAESNAASIVKGEWGPATISCVSNGGCGSSLGNTYGTPLIRRLHNGQWAVIFGNGYGSATGDAGIFVMTIDPSDSTGKTRKFYYLSTGVSGSNGIAYVTSADLDGDHVTDYVYAGDLLGNVWKFDLTSATATSWAVVAAPVFKTATGQPITTPVVLATAILSGSSRSLIVSFGTGRRTPFTLTSATLYASGTQSLYGVWDWNFAAWNAKSTSQYASLTGAQVHVATGGSTGLNSPYTLGPANLQAQTFSLNASGAIDTSNNAVVYAACASASVCTGSKFGWYANLIGASEQIVSGPTLYLQSLIVNSIVPANNAVLSCTSNADTGYSYVISVTTGGTFVSSTGALVSAFVTNNTTNTTDVSMVGSLTNESGGLTVVNTAENTTFLIGQAITPPSYGQTPTQPIQIALPPNAKVKRVTWTQLR